MERFPLRGRRRLVGAGKDAVVASRDATIGVSAFPVKDGDRNSRRRQAGAGAR